jgi:pseudouridylate synthase
MPESSIHPYGILLHAEVEEALHSGRPVVALESTVIAHGLPYPRNLETALALEETVRAGGAAPATIAVLDGRPHVGLALPEIEFLSTSRDVQKLSTRDLAIAVARKANGATTVATTMIIAARAGIQVFATGGIGGVHRGTASDISADLPELARTRMIVVCAGAKAILDLPATLEWLETHGVPVLGYQTSEFPAFYSAQSGLPVDACVQTPRDVVAIAGEHWSWELGGGLLVAAPPPARSSMPHHQMEIAIDRALRDAEEQAIRGKALTPFLLNRISQLTAGISLEANLALLHNNARIAAQIAVELARLQHAIPFRGDACE